MANWFESFFGGGGDKNELQWSTPPAPTFHKAPEYPETTGARGEWWQRIQDWGNQRGYGAIAPDWGDIWDKASTRIKQYYWGGPEGGAGLAGKVKASAARRNVAESPALETGLTRLSATEGRDLGELATNMATEEAEFGEAGRQNWLQNISQIANLKVPGTWQSAQAYTPAQSTPWGDLASAVGSFFGAGGGGGFNGQSLYDFFGNMGSPGKMKQSPYGQTLPTSEEFFGTPDWAKKEKGVDWGDLALKAAPLLLAAL